jgi:hypothetical protein
LAIRSKKKNTKAINETLENNGITLDGILQCQFRNIIFPRTSRFSKENQGV